MAKDPVCGMTVNEQQAQQSNLTSQYKGQTFYFCNPGCKRDFEQNPERYAGKME